jgi:hypothetical protein
VDEPYKASLVNIYKDGVIVDAACCAADSELVGAHGAQVVHYVLHKKGKKDINIRSTSGWTL